MMFNYILQNYFYTVIITYIYYFDILNVIVVKNIMDT